MVREATTKFHRTQAARETGYNLIPGLDTCFQNYPRDGLGYHHINTSLLNSALDILDPEAIVYVPDQREGRICMFCTPGFGRITPLA